MNPLPKVNRSFSATGLAGMKRQALAWAKRELTLATSRMGKDEAENHVLAEVGRHWNIGCQRHVGQVLRIEWHTPNEPEVEELDDE